MSKLCLILTNYDPNDSSHYFHLHELIELLAKKNDIFFFAESGDRKLHLNHINHYYVQRFKFLPLKLLERITALFWVYIKGYRKFYCHYADFSTIYTSLTTRLLGGSTYKWHCVQEHFYSRPLALNLPVLKDKLIREVPFYLSLKLCHFLVTSSQEMKNYYQKYYSLPSNKIIIIPNYINLNRFSVPTRPKTHLKNSLKLPQKPLLLFVHRLSKRKGADRLIDYAKTIKNQRLNLFILAIGKGPLLDSLRSQARKLSLTNQIRFIGSVPNKHLPLYYRASDIFIMPSRIEEFARVQLEAMACGLLVIATGTTAAHSVLTSKLQDLTVSQNTHHQIVAIAHGLLRNHKLYRSLQKIGINRVKTFSLPKAAKTFETKILKLTPK